MDDRRLPTWMRLGIDPKAIEKVVTHVNRVRPSARKKLAKDIVTIAYLDAGRRLIEQNLWGPAAAPDSYVVLDWLTRESICAEVERGPEPLPRKASSGSFRDRWRSKDDYLADLVAYLNWNAHWEPHRRLAHGSVPELLDSGRPLGDVVHDVAYQDLSLTTAPEHIGAKLTQTALYSLARRTPTVRTALRTRYAEILRLWGETYQRVVAGRGIRLRPDVSVSDVTTILAAVSDGLSLQAFADGTDKIVDEEARTSLLGTTALALILAVVDPGDGRSMKELVDELGRRFPPTTAGGAGPDRHA